jgi:dTDP-4-dehydrorhamnose 3,5-epimerase
MDADLGIDWPLLGEPRLSDRDAGAPRLKELLNSGLLPDYQECLRYTGSLDAAQAARTTGAHR